jgi:ubiquinone biosynthesis O-methyltransferase
MSDNKKLREKYNDVYKNGKESFFSRFSNGEDISETDKTVLESINWVDKRVIDIGCGTGNTAARIAEIGARSVLGIDYSSNAIKLANNRYSFDNLEFQVGSLKSLESSTEIFDIVTSLGTLEHMDDPKKSLRQMLKMVNEGGQVVLVCPYFINTRGIVWMTLQLLLDVPMSLTDKHFISPFDIRRWIDGTGFELSKTTCFDYDRANGELMLIDMEKRLSNALSDANLSNDNVPKMISWLKNIVQNESEYLTCMGGSNALYIIRRKG